MGSNKQAPCGLFKRFTSIYDELTVDQKAKILAQMVGMAAGTYFDNASADAKIAALDLSSKDENRM